MKRNWKELRGASSHIGGKLSTTNVASRAKIEEDKSIYRSTSTRERKIIQHRQTSISFQDQNGFHAGKVTVQKDKSLLDNQQQQ